LPERLSPLPAVLLALFAALLAFFPIVSVDIWWHLKTGDWILAEGRLPTRDLFTYTVSPETRWYDTQWLFQVAVALAYRAGGWSGLIALRMAACAAIGVVLYLWLAERRLPPWAALAAGAVVLAAMRYRFFQRPELYSFLYIAIQLWLLDRASRRGRLELHWLVPLQLLWSWTHSSCILGIFVAGVWSIWQLLRNKSLVLSAAGETSVWWPLRAPLFYLAVAVLATLANPNGIVQLTYGFGEGTKLFIEEFLPPRPAFFLSPMGLVLLLAAGGLGGIWRRRDVFLAVLVAVFLTQSFRMVRFFPYAAIAAAPLVAACLVEVARLLAHKSRWTRFACGGLGLGVFVALAVLSFSTDRKTPFRGGTSGQNEPAAAVDFILKENISGHLFHLPDDGAYLLWRLAPRGKVMAFNETRLNAELLERVSSLSGGTAWRRLADELQCTHALVPTNAFIGGPESPSIATMIQSWPGWIPVFWDDDYIVFAREIPELAEMIQRRRSGFFPEWIPRRGVAGGDPVGLQTTLRDPAAWEALRPELERAIAESPHHFCAAYALGVGNDLLDRNPVEAMRHFRIAESFDSRAPDLLSLMGVRLFKDGDPAQGRLYLSRAARNTPAPEEALCNLAMAELLYGEKAEAARLAAEVLRMVPNHPRATDLAKRLNTP